MLNTSIKDAPNFIRISVFSMKKSYLKITYGLLNTKLCDGQGFQLVLMVGETNSMVDYYLMAEDHSKITYLQGEV